jgi:hypothetical protein
MLLIIPCSTRNKDAADTTPNKETKKFRDTIAMLRERYMKVINKKIKNTIEL